MPISREGAKEGDRHPKDNLAKSILRLAHIPTNVARVSDRGLSTILKSKTLLVRMLIRLQHQSMAMMIQGMSAWAKGAGPLEQRFVVVGVCHAWDDTTQKLREPQRLAGARRSTQRVSQSVLVQKNMVQSSALQLRNDGAFQFFARAENFAIPPLEVPGKSAEDLRDVMMASSAWRGPLNIEDKSSMLALSGSVDALVLTFWPDGATQNARWLKHVCGLSVHDNWPNNLLIDPQELCLIHQTHRIKVNCLEAQSMIGLLFCFSKLGRSGTLFKTLADQICEFVDKRLHIVVGVRPPTGGAETSRKLFDLIYDLNSEHHSRGKAGDRKSQLWQDVQDVLAIDNSGFSNREQILHYCCDAKGKMCCQDAEDTRTKLKSAYLNLFVSRCWPEGTLSRWTHVRTLLGLLCAGFLSRGVLHLSLLPSLQQDSAAHAEEAARELGADTAGAGEADALVQHRARKAKVQAWLAKPETPWQLAVVFLTTSILDRITYFLMTGGQGSAPVKLGTMAKAEQPIEIRQMWALTKDCRAALWDLLHRFDDPQSLARQLLRGMGVADEVATSTACLLFVRRHALQMSAGLFRRFELRLGCFPYRLWVLCDDRVGAEAKQAAINAFHGLPACCAGWFGKQLKQLFPTKEALAGPLCKVVIQTWQRTLIFSTYGCEREHASVRRLVGGSVGPGRNFSLVARERVLETARSVHIDRLHSDPRDDAGMSPAKRRRALPGGNECADNPLFTDAPELEWRDGQPQIRAPPEEHHGPSAGGAAVARLPRLFRPLHCHCHWNGQQQVCLLFGAHWQLGHQSALAMCAFCLCVCACVRWRLRALALGKPVGQGLHNSCRNHR